MSGAGLRSGPFHYAIIDAGIRTTNKGNNMPKNAQTRPGNLTGKKKEEMAAEHAEEVKAREGEIALMNAAAEQEKAETVNYSGEAVTNDDVKEAVAQKQVEVKEKTRVIRVNENIEQMTFGRGTSYDFEVGRTYKVPAELADHLEEIGYIYH